MENETVGKLVGLGFAAVFFVYAGLIALVVIVPLVLIIWIIDFFFRHGYNKDLKAWREQFGIEPEPQVSLEIIEDDEGKPLIGWQAVLPKGCYLEIYRLSEEAGASIARVREKGQLVLTTPKAEMEDEDDILHDTSAPDGTLYYVPVITGEREDERVCEYSSFSFSSKLRFVTKVQPLEKRGHSMILRRKDLSEKSLSLPDHRSSIAKQRDKILDAIETRKAEDNELDEAIEAIRKDERFTEDEKAFAIAQLESRYEPG